MKGEKMPAIKMTINLPDSIRQILKLAPWGNRQATSSICKSIDRYNLIIKAEKKSVQELFSLAELNLFFELCKNKNFIPAEKCKDGILLEVANASDDFLNGFNRSEIIEKLQNLTTVQSVALVEVMEDFADKLK